MDKINTIIPLLFTSCLCQFVVDLGMKPDVTFGEDNERFDVASIIQDQSRMDAANPTDDFRRHENSIIDTKGNKENEDKEEQLLHALKETVGNVDFAQHSKMDSSLDDDDYEKNLKVFENGRRVQEIVGSLYRGLESRRGIPPDPENVILFRHGVPVNVKIEGFLEVPLDK